MINYLITIIIITYFVISGIALDIRLTEFRVDEHCKPYEYEREVNPIDVWIAILWPIWLCVFFIKIALFILHIAIGYGLFLFNIKYIKTERFKRIGEFLGY